MSNRFTPLMLFGISFLLWLVGFFVGRSGAESAFMGYESGNVLQYLLSLLLFAASSVVVSSFHLFERRIYWLASLVFALIAVSLFIHGDLACAVSLLLFVVLLSCLFSCVQGCDNRRSLFSIFALFGAASFFYPQFMTLLPVLLLYIYMSGLGGVKGFLSALLGLLLPFWFIFGAIYIWPEAAGFAGDFYARVSCLASAGGRHLSVTDAVAAAAWLAVTLPYAALFTGSAVPGKPYLRKRLQFLMLLDIYLFVLSMIYTNDFEIYYTWSLPIKGIMLSYIYTSKITFFTRYYFVLINIIWLLLAPLELWLMY